MKSIALGAGTLAAGNGGIARVARMSGRALVEAGYAVAAHTLLDEETVPFVASRPIAFARGSKLKFATLCACGALGASHCLYDHVGLARVHTLLWTIKRPYAVWIHGVEVWEALSRPAEAVLRKADLVLVNSHHTIERFEHLHGPLTTARVCWLGTEADDEPAPTPAGTRSEGPTTVLILGRIESEGNYKGHAELIAAWPQVLAAVPDARLVIAGGGPGLALMREMAAMSPVGDHIDVPGFVPEAEMPALWQRASAFAMPSRGEGFGIGYIEAMRYGVPVIASVHDAGQEVNIDGETGFNVDLNDGAQLSHHLIRLLSNPYLAARVGAAGRRRWREHFRYSAFKSRFLPLFETFVSGEL